MFRKDKYEVYMVNAAHNRHGRVDYFSKDVYAHRLANLCTLLGDQGLDALVIFRRGSYTDPYLLWLAGKHESSDAYTYIIKDGQLIEIDDRPGGPPEGEDWPPKNLKPGDGPPKPPPDAPEPVQGRKGPDISPYLQPGADTKIKKHLSGLNKIAFIGLGSVDWQFMSLIRDIAPQAELVDMTAQLDRLREIKDSAEIQAITEAVYVEEKALESLPNISRFSQYEKDVSAGLQGVMRRYGSDFCGGACPMANVIHIDGTPDSSIPWPGPQWPGSGPRMVTIFGHGAGGYKAITARTVVFSKTTDTQAGLYSLCCQTMNQLFSALIPGALIGATVNNALAQWSGTGYSPAITVNGVGVTDRESPMAEHGLPLRQGMAVAVTVCVKTEDGYLGLANTCVISPDGCERIGRLSDEIIRI